MLTALCWRARLGIATEQVSILLQMQSKQWYPHLGLGHSAMITRHCMRRFAAQRGADRAAALGEQHQVADSAVERGMMSARAKDVGIEQRFAINDSEAVGVTSEALTQCRHARRPDKKRNCPRIA